MPRVITGKYRGAVLLAPKGDATRPTTDKVKEALFSMIQMRVPDARVLDLFSGTGQIGIEAVSRGATEAVMVDKGSEPARIIAKNLEKIRYDSSTKEGKLTFLKLSATAAIDRLHEQNKVFDIVFLDPPYAKAHDEAKAVAERLMRYDMLSDDGIMIVEHSSDLPFNTDVNNMKFVRSCSYGLTVITFFSKG